MKLPVPRGKLTLTKLYMKKLGVGEVSTYNNIKEHIRFEAFTATKTNKILPGFQPRQMVKSSSVSLRTRTEMVLETSVLSTFIYF
jgi:hypothetical protein